VVACNGIANNQNVFAWLGVLLVLGLLGEDIGQYRHWMKKRAIEFGFVAPDNGNRLASKRRGFNMVWWSARGRWCGVA
jgi:hypothetical protein